MHHMHAPTDRMTHPKLDHDCDAPNDAALHEQTADLIHTNAND